MAEKGRDSALMVAMDQLEKKFGVGSIMRLGDRPKMEVDVIPTGAINLDVALGIGGIPRGRITEVYGNEASGKTTLSLHIAAEAQKLGGVVAFVDAEHALDPIYAKNLGIDVDNLFLSQPDSGEQALEILETLVRSNAVDLIVLDSVAALVPRAEIDGEMGDTHVGLQARLMSQALRKLAAVINKSNTAVIFINQIRMKIGGMMNPYMNPETTTGGVALKFYSSVRLEIRRATSIREAGSQTDFVGSITRVKVVKNKFAPPFKRVEFPIIFGKGISHLDILITLGVQHNILKRSGAWLSYGELRIGQGTEKAKVFLQQDQKILDEIETKVRKAVGLDKSESQGNKEES